ncbi:PAS domain-containing protein [Natronobacterium texcoconense]|uniref:PAS domain S-box-containing protein n=1 Tax=Natronobacterium texcoconense TaxID=1095778 RepID=A0A1H1I1Q1_NATTX|nr:PAS domain-containing protein [Natronobacterium texcoconense]SDR31624.1 PAS domain S-box-containing protein [Natronobacterium texcoconense]
MSTPSIDTIPYEPPMGDDVLAVLVTGDDRVARHLETPQTNSIPLDITTAPTLSAAFDRLSGIDCFVCRYPLETASLEETIERVRRRRPGLPVLVVTDDSRLTAVRDATADHRWIDVIVADETASIDERLRYRVPRLVERKHLSTLSNRSLAGIELAGDAIAIVNPNGTLEFPNRSFAVKFGTDRDDLVGQPWQDLFTPETVDRLETTAIPTVEDGWRWTGTCTGRRTDGTEFQTRVSVGGLEDGSLVFVVDGLETA